MDRSNKATLPLTIPRSIFKSSAKDLSPPIRRIAMCYGLGLAPIGTESHRGRKGSSRSSRDSDLEAFSHNPADDSVSPAAFQPSENTKYLNQRFLSY